MKKILTVIVALVAAVGSFAQQPTGTLSVAPKAGINISTMTKAIEGKMKVGFVGGVDLTYQMADAFALSGGLFYSQQGMKQELSSTITSSHKNDYFNVPILANYYIAPGLAIKAGVQFGALLSAKLKSGNDIASATVDVKEAYKSLDIAIPIGVSYEFSHLIIDARYNFGLTTSVKDLEESSKNNVIMLTVGYKINL